MTSKKAKKIARQALIEAYEELEDLGMEAVSSEPTIQQGCREAARKSDAALKTELHRANQGK